MKLRVHFGLIDTKEVNWYQTFESFPYIVKYLGRNYEWVAYDKDPNGKVDMILNYSEVPSYDPNYDVVCPVWSNMFNDDFMKCECGSAYSSFPWDHFRYCRLWTKW